MNATRIMAGLLVGVLAGNAFGQIRTGGISYGNSFMGFRGPTSAPPISVISHPNPVCPPRPCPPVYRYPVYTGSGLTVNGRYSDDHWNVGFHVGNGWDGGVYPSSYNCVPTYDNCRPYSNDYCYPAYRYGRGYTIFPNGYVYDWDRSYGRTYGYNTTAYDPRLGASPLPPTPAPEPEPETALEKARWQMNRDNPDAAIKAFQEHLKEFQQDSSAMRELGVALLSAGRIAEGVAMIREAYTQNPALADDALDMNAVGGEDEVAQLVRRTSMYANKGLGSSPWLALTVLMQSQERDRVALNNLVKAVEQGLESEIAVPLGDALRRKAYAGAR